ncbi:MAG: Mov34/MPN/PAD-1 family protein [Deltaproteobacteria bacterium]|nr:Mov34/MPN/PAD-1 family protein [Deltaproteobacteria bacterium]
MVDDTLMLLQGYGRRMTVCDKVAGIWLEHRQTTAVADESFGVLMGTTSVDRREIWIETVTTPMAHDRRSRFCFALRDPGHQLAVHEKFASSGGRGIYLGTWHTHPEPIPKPSKIDRTDWGTCLRANRERPLVFVLVGTEEIRVFVRASGRFRPLRRE